jgi:hypothetical protein
MSVTSSNEHKKQQQNNGSLTKEKKTTPDRPTINQTMVQFTDLSRSIDPYCYIWVRIGRLHVN